MSLPAISGVSLPDTFKLYKISVTTSAEVVTDILYNLNVSGSDTPDIAGNDTYIVDGVVVHNK